MSEYRNGTALHYDLRLADPFDRREHEDAHEVRLMDGQRPLRTLGVWKAERIATQVAAVLNQWAGSQIR